MAYEEIIRLIEEQGRDLREIKGALQMATGRLTTLGNAVACLPKPDEPDEDYWWPADQPPPKDGYYLAAWRLPGHERWHVSELWFNPDSPGSGWWSTRAYLNGLRGIDDPLPVVAWMPMPAYEGPMTTPDDAHPPTPDSQTVAWEKAAANLMSATTDGLLQALEAEGVVISADQRRRAVNRLIYGTPHSPAEEADTNDPERIKTERAMTDRALRQYGPALDALKEYDE